jgi:hypothetical protein
LNLPKVMLLWRCRASLAAFHALLCRASILPFLCRQCAYMCCVRGDKQTQASGRHICNSCLIRCAAALHMVCLLARPVLFNLAGIVSLAIQSEAYNNVQASHPLLWDQDQLEWLKGSPMADKLAARADQVRDDMEDLLRAGANELLPAASDSGEAVVVTEQSARWVAATLLSRAFNLEIPAEGVSACQRVSNGAYLAASSLIRACGV